MLDRIRGKVLDIVGFLNNRLGPSYLRVQSLWL